MTSSPSAALVPDEESTSSEAAAFRDWAVDLQASLRSAGVRTNARHDNNTRQLRILAKRVGAARVRSLLDWYQPRIKSIAKPSVRSVRHFCKVFEWLEDVAKGNHPTVASKNIQLSKELEHLYKVCKLHRHWPNVTDDALKSFLQQTHDNAAALRERLKELAPSNRFAAHILEKYLSRPLSLTEFWAEHVNDRVKNWTAFSGNLSPFVFHVGHKDFDAMARSWAGQWGLATRADKVWNELKEELCRAETTRPRRNA